MNGISEKEKKTKKEEIITKCKENSYTTHIISAVPLGWKSEIFNFKDIIKFKLFNFNFNRKFYPQTSTIHFLYKVYNPNNEKGIKEFNKNLNKILLMTYRSKYRRQINIKNKYEYNSDCGWGCMIRSSQMIFARMLYKIFKQIYKNQYDSKTLTISAIPYFMDDYIILDDLKGSDYLVLGLDSYINKLKLFLKEKIEKNQYKKSEIQSIDPPFSIHKICIIGEIFGRTCGEWFSDFELPDIYEIINTTFSIIPNLSIMHFNTNIEINKILEKCFEKENDDKNPNLFKNNYFIINQNEKYKLKKMGAIFVSVRLGISMISPEYFPSIKKLFECRQFLGFIGGKADSASYFFGYCDDSLLYLDPHLNQQSDSYLDDKTKDTYINKTVFELDFKSLQCAFTAGFLFRNLNEFSKLIDFLKKYNDENCPCFHFHFDKTIQKDDENFEKEMKYLDNDKNDF
jgi:hypothetical protein